MVQLGRRFSIAFAFAFIFICISYQVVQADSDDYSEDGRVGRSESNLVSDIFTGSIFSNNDQSNPGKFQLNPAISASQIMQTANKPEVARAVTSTSLLPDLHCLEVVSECENNIYYVAFADGSAQLQMGFESQDKPQYYQDSIGWYRLDANHPTAKYCSHSYQIALYIDMSDDWIQQPRSEVYWSRESGNYTGKWCVDPTQIFHYRYYHGSEFENSGYYTDLDTGEMFHTCDDRHGVFMEFYEYPVAGIHSYNQLRILTCLF
eukprot:TRINITY_DN2186_c0_g1_i3.p1 TRINITY_DN2186_c0_g1~~TRINITY_DN2186_c0_g1_i3.p1  ORF type:complete len:262 (-),score=24.39 TRINITY_DN2186_c0_g1_i3:265-1050(-)